MEFQTNAAAAYAILSQPVVAQIWTAVCCVVAYLLCKRIRCEKIHVASHVYMQARHRR